MLIKEDAPAGNSKVAGYYIWPNRLDAMYRKLLSGKWQVSFPKSKEWIDLVKGNVQERTKNLENGAQPAELNLLFVGDSNTASASGGKFYGWWIQRLLGYRVNIERVAKGGKGTQWMIDNLGPHLAGKPKGHYSIISILGGSNDIWGGRDFDYTKTRIETLVRMAEDHGARAVVISPPSKEFLPDVVKGEEWTKPKLAELKKFVEWEKATYGNRFLNFNWITSPKGGAKVSDFENDGRHLRPQPKHEELAKIWIQKIYWGIGPSVNEPLMSQVVSKVASSVAKQGSDKGVKL